MENVRQPRSTSSRDDAHPRATHRTGHVDAAEQEEQFNRRSIFRVALSTSDSLERKRKRGREEAAAATAVVVTSVSFSFPRFAFSGGKKKKKERNGIKIVHTITILGYY
jgi:hypothetical protein